MREEDFHRRMNDFLPLMQQSLHTAYGQRNSAREEHRPHLTTALRLSLHYFFRARDPAGAEVQRRLVAYRYAEDRLANAKRLCVGLPIFTVVAGSVLLVKKKVYANFTVSESLAFFTLIIGLLPTTLYPLYVRLCCRPMLQAREEAYGQLGQLCESQPYASLLSAS